MTDEMKGAMEEDRNARLEERMRVLERSARMNHHALRYGGWIRTVVGVIVAVLLSSALINEQYRPAQIAGCMDRTADSWDTALKDFKDAEREFALAAVPDQSPKINAAHEESAKQAQTAAINISTRTRGTPELRQQFCHDRYPAAFPYNVLGAN